VGEGGGLTNNFCFCSFALTPPLENSPMSEHLTYEYRPNVIMLHDFFLTHLG